MEFLFSSSQCLSSPMPPCDRTWDAWTADEGRRCNSGASYSRAAMEKVMAMLPPTMSAIAIMNSMKIRRNRLCMGPGEGVAGAADILDLGILAGLQIELAAQIADVGVDAAIVSHQLAAER